MRFAVLASGGGSNLQRLIDASGRGELGPAQLVVVGVNVAGCGAVERARNAGLPVFVVEHKAYPSRADFDRALLDALRSHQVELVVLAGFMRILGAEVVTAFADRLVNIHPALLPTFPGTNSQLQAIEHGVKFSGCTVHFVDPGVDTGPIIAQAVIPVRDDDDVRALRGRILVEEHRLLPEVVRAIAEGRVERQGRRVLVRGAIPTGEVMRSL